MTAGWSSRRTRMRLRDFAWSVALWTLAAFVFGLVRFVGLDDLPQFREVDLSGLDTWGSVGWATAAGVVLGVVFGLLDPVLDRALSRRLPYGGLIAAQASARVVVFGTVLMSMQFARYRATPAEAVANLLNPNIVVTVAYASLVSVIVAFVRSVDRKLGPGNLRKLLLGRYHRPREERRIFLFLDLQSSTTLAERLGHVRYSRLIQDCFRDLAVVIEDDAEVYQYVGDEAVLCWEEALGLQDAACVRAFFRFDDRIQARAAVYEARYGVVPVFKAGANLGVVTVAEVGEIKSEIAFHGDVLNTASRIQSRSNDLGRRLLVSEALLRALGPLDGYVAEALGTVALKGREESVAIYAVDRISERSGSP